MLGIDRNSISRYVTYIYTRPSGQITEIRCCITRESVHNPSRTWHLLQQVMNPSSTPSVLSASGLATQCDGVDDAPAVRHKAGDRYDQLAVARSLRKRALGQLAQLAPNVILRLPGS